MKLGHVTASLLVQKLQASPAKRVGAGSPGIWPVGQDLTRAPVVCQHG